MPLTRKGRKIMRSMKRQYGPEKGESVFYASKNAGTVSGVEHRGRKAKKKSRHGRRPK